MGAQEVTVVDLEAEEGQGFFNEITPIAPAGLGNVSQGSEATVVCDEQWFRRLSQDEPDEFKIWGRSPSSVM